MGKTLYLHIGHFKTGTTAIQAACEGNPRLLARHGLHYAKAHRQLGKHSRMAFALYHAVGVTQLMHGYNRTETPEEVWQDIFDEALSAKADKTLISTEELARLGALPHAEERLARIVARAPKGLDLRVVAYLRSPQAHLLSWYNQLVKMQIKVPPFNEAITGFMELVHLDYAQMIAPWARLFGDDRLILRPYVKTPEDPLALLRDIFSTLGVPVPVDRLRLPDSDPNPGLPQDRLELVRVLQNAGLPPVMVRQALDRLPQVPPAPNAWGLREQALRALRDQSAAGLAHVSALSGGAIPADSFAADLPTRLPEPHAALLLTLEAALTELQSFRRQTNQQMTQLTQRLEALEAAQASPSKPGASKPGPARPWRRG